jgi:membrane associated rhomboid family serine protease
MKNIWSSFQLASLAIFVLWTVYFLELLLPFNISNLGVHPREISGLVGIFFEPFLHANFSHLMANSISLFILLFVVFVHDRYSAGRVIFTIVIAGGLGTWLFGADGSVHIGASGLILGLVGYLLLIGFYLKDLKSIGISVFIFMLYGGTLLLNLIPISGISWSSHFFGFIGGLIAARQARKK